jgi:hypothetical protein
MTSFKSYEKRGGLSTIMQAESLLLLFWLYVCCLGDEPLICCCYSPLKSEPLSSITLSIFFSLRFEFFLFLRTIVVAVPFFYLVSESGRITDDWDESTTN